MASKRITKRKVVKRRGGGKRNKRNKITRRKYQNKGGDLTLTELDTEKKRRNVLHWTTQKEKYTDNIKKLEEKIKILEKTIKSNEDQAKRETYGNPSDYSNSNQESIELNKLKEDMKEEKTKLQSAIDNLNINLE